MYFLQIRPDQFDYVFYITYETKNRGGGDKKNTNRKICYFIYYSKINYYL
jgi:hypothetical protein